MNFIEILRARLAEIDTARSQKREEMEQVVAKATEEKRSALTATEENAFTALEAEIKALDEERSAAQERLEYLEKLAAERAQSEKMLADAGVRYDVPSVNLGRDPWDTSDINARGREQLHGQVRSAIESLPISAADGDAALDRLRTVDNARGDLAKRMLLTGNLDYTRAIGKVMDGAEYALTDKERARLAEMRAAGLTDASGGYAVPFTMDPTVIDTSDGSVNPFRQLGTVKTTLTDQWAGVTSAGVTASYAAEATQASDNAPTLGQPEIKVHKAQAFIPYSIEISQDWAQMAAEFRAMLGRARDDLEATKFAVGAGNASNEPVGIVTALAASQGGSSIVLPTTPETFAVDDLYKIEEDLPARYRARASWVADKPIYNKIRQFGTSDSHALWERLGGGQPARLLGYPTYESSAMDSDWNPAATAANYILVFGDVSAYYIVDRVGLTIDLVPHLFGADQRPTGQRGIYAFWRNGADVVNDGALRVLNIATTA